MGSIVFHVESRKHHLINVYVDFSKTSAIEDETYFLVSCNFYSGIRSDLFKNAVDMNTNFLSMSDSYKLPFFNENRYVTI